MGTLQIVLNRYLYCLRNVKKNGERVWKCINFCKGMCLARIVVKDNKVVKRACAHNHPYHDAQILKRLRNRNMFTTMNEVEEAINIKKKQSTDTKTNTPTKTKDTKDKQDDTLSD